jgi:hypothetical protein
MSNAAKKLVNKGVLVAKGTTNEAWLVVAVLACIFTAALIVLILTWSDDLAMEAGKTSLSVLAVSVFGALAALAIDQYKRRREDDAQAFQRQLDEDRDEAANKRQRQEEDWRRELARLRDTRNREDALLRSLLQDTLRAYNKVKRTRRLLKAFTMSAAGRTLRLEIYDAHMQELMDLQLMFEEFKRLTGVSADRRLRLPVLAAKYELIEKNLNKVIDEYIENRHRVETRGVLPLEEFPRLSGLFHGEYPLVVGRKTVDAGFERNVSTPIDEIIRQVQEALLEPLDFPTVTRSVEPVLLLRGDSIGP